MNIEYTSRLEKIEVALETALPPSFGADWTAFAFSSLPAAVRPSHLGPLVEPCRDLLSRGGKRWRPLFLVLSCELSGGGDRAYGLTPIVEFAHTASLIHDDIEDGADERRGKPAIHLLYGVDTAINAASWLYFLAEATIDSFPSSDSLKIVLHRTVARELRRLHLGQAMDIGWHRTPEFVPVRAEYEAMVSLKTGTLSRLAAELGVLAAGADEGAATAFGDLATGVGVGFQILDDVRNLTTGNPGKKRGDDVVEGKKSLPVIMHLERRPEDLAYLSERFRRARAEGIGSPAVEEVIQRLHESGAVDAAREAGRALIERASLSIQGRFPGNPVAPLVSGLFETMLEGLV